MKVPISNRLLLCAEFGPRGTRAAAIGTDHGYLAVYLLCEGICPFVTAADLREQPLQKARENAARFGVGTAIRSISMEARNMKMPVALSPTTVADCPK